MYNFGKLLGLTILSIAAISIISSHKAYAAYCDMLVPTSAGSKASNCDNYVNQANTSGVSSAGGLISDLQADLSSNVPADKTSAQWIIDQTSPNGTLSGLQQALAQPGVTIKVVDLGVATDPCADTGYDPSTNSVVHIEQCDPSGNPVLQIIQNGKQILMLRRACGNAIGGTARLVLNHPPTGHFVSVTCSQAAETYTFKFDYDDPDGATTAELRNKAGGVIWGPNGGTSATWTVNTKNLPTTDFNVTLWVKDVGPAADNQYKDVASTGYPNCLPVGSINTVAGSCYEVTLKLWDPNNYDSSIKYDLNINGTQFGPYSFGGQAAATYTQAIQTLYQNSGAKGFTQWAPNKVELVGIDNQTGAQVNLGTVTIGSTCGEVFCGVSSLGSPVTAGEQVQFNVDMTMGSHSPSYPPDGPPGSKFLTIDFDTLNATNVAYTDTGGDLYSAQQTYTPQKAGFYTVNWTFGGGQAPGGIPPCHAAAPTEVAYQQYFTTLGGDTSAGRGYLYSGTTCHQDNSAGIAGINLDSGIVPRNFFGASSQNAAIATGNITEFASNATNNIAANTATGAGGSTDGIAGDIPSGLAFASTTASGTTYGGGILGTSGENWCVPDYASTVTGSNGTSLPTAAALDVLPQGSYVYRVAGNLPNLGGFQLPNGVNLTVIVSGSVYINGNITYAGYTKLQQIPQFNLMTTGGGDIYIDPGVSVLNGFYNAEPSATNTGGVIYTCASNTGGVFSYVKDYDTCSTNALAVYGAVSANQIVPGRTIGNVAKATGLVNSDYPAEQFVYTPELWLGSVSGPTTSCATDPAQVNCMYQSYTSLPPVL